MNVNEENSEDLQEPITRLANIYFLLMIQSNLLNDMTSKRLVGIFLWHVNSS